MLPLRWQVLPAVLLLLWAGVPAAAARSGRRSLDRALFKALIVADFPKVQALLDRGADPNARSHEFLDRTALIMAAEMPQRGFHPDEDRNIFLAVQLLLDRGARIEDTDPEGQTALVLAAEGGSPQVVELLLRRGADLKRSGAAALCAATRARDRSRPVIQLLLDWGVSLNPTGTIHVPLECAALAGDLTLSQWLIDKGASVKRSGAMAMIWLVHAQRERAREIVEYFLASGVDINAPDPLDGANLFAAQVIIGPLDLLRYLLDKGADPRRIDKLGRNHLHWCAIWDLRDRIPFFLGLGLDPMLRDKDGKTPVDLATTLEMAALLRGTR